MYPLPSTPMSHQHDLPGVPEGTWPDEDDVLDGWLASLSVRELERVLSHLTEHPVSVPTVLDATA